MQGHQYVDYQDGAADFDDLATRKRYTDESLEARCTSYSSYCTCSWMMLALIKDDK